MTFNPLGKFDFRAPLSQAALHAALGYVYLLQNHYPCPLGSIRRIYKHWTVGHFNQDFPDYNGALRYQDGHFYFDVCGNPQDNAIGVNDNEPHPHTYRRNTGAFGFSTDDMVFASPQDFGPEPVTLTAVDWLCAGVAAVAVAYEVDLSSRAMSGPYKGEYVSYTHAEAADHPGDPAQYANYYVTGERWDFASLVPFPEGVTFKEVDPSIVGDALRIRERAYKLQLTTLMKKGHP